MFARSGGLIYAVAFQVMTVVIVISGVLYGALHWRYGTSRDKLMWTFRLVRSYNKGHKRDVDYYYKT